MACCVISNCGSNVTINTCCDDTGISPDDYNDIFGSGTGLDGSWSDNATVSNEGNLLVDYICQPNGDLYIKWATKLPTSTEMYIDGVNTVPDSNNSHTIEAYDATSIISVKILDTAEQVTVFPTVCEALGSYVFTSACRVSPQGYNQILLSWDTSEMVYVYRVNDNTLITKTNQVNEYPDIAPLLGTNDYILSSTSIEDGLTELATVSHNFFDCITPCSNPAKEPSPEGFRILKDTSDAEQYLYSSLTCEVRVPNTSNRVSWLNLPKFNDNDNGRYSLRIHKGSSGTRVDDEEYTWSVNGYRSVPDDGIYISVTVANPNATNSMDWPHRIVLVPDVCRE